MPTHSELQAKIARLELDLIAARTAEQAAWAACKGAMEERDAYKQCLQMYADHDNWGCTAISSHNHDCDTQPEGCCLDEWQGPVGVHGYEEAERVIAKYRGGDVL